jgi:hypothetical protein
VKDQISHPKQTGLIIILYILFFVCLDMRRDDNKSCQLNGSKYDNSNNDNNSNNKNANNVLTSSFSLAMVVMELR